MTGIDKEREQPEREDERIVRALEREARRRKRILAFYLSLLVIPVATGVWYLRHGQLDRQLVRQEVWQEVKPVKEQLEAVEPALETVQGAAAQLASQHSELSALREDQEQVRGQVAPIAQRVESFAADLAEVRRVSDAIPEIREQMNGYTERLTRLAGEQADLRRDQEALSRQQRALAEDVRTLRQRVDTSPGAARPDQLQELLRNLRELERKVGVVGSDLNNLQRRVERIQPTPR